MICGKAEQSDSMRDRLSDAEVDSSPEPDRAHVFPLLLSSEIHVVLNISFLGP